MSFGDNHTIDALVELAAERMLLGLEAESVAYDSARVHLSMADFLYVSPQVCRTEFVYRLNTQPITRAEARTLLAERKKRMALA